MAISYVDYVGNGATTNFSVTFPYLDRDHVGAKVNGSTVSFSWVNSTTVSISPAPANGARVRLYRDTPSLTPNVDFQDGAIVTEEQLDTNAKQTLYVSQESEDEAAAALGPTADATNWDGESKRITNVDDPVDDQDVATKAYVAQEVGADYNEQAEEAAAEAAASALAAAASAASAAAAFDSFDGRYLGAKAVAPTLDNDGNALATGALYFDTVLTRMRQWDGAAWVTIEPGITQVAGDARYARLTGGNTLTGTQDVTGGRIQVPTRTAGDNGTDAASTAFVRSATIGRTTVANAAYTVVATDMLVAYTSLSASCTVTLPAASTIPAGKRLVIVDESGSASQSVAISLAPNGTDTVAGSNSTQVIINIPRGRIEIESNGSNGWHVVGDWSVRYRATLGADVPLNNTGSYFDIVSVAQGTVGTWRCRSKVCVTSGGIANINAKLWDGSTTIDSGRETVAGANQAHMIPLFEDITSPAGNIKVSVNDASRTDGTVKFNFSGNSKDTTLVVYRIA